MASLTATPQSSILPLHAAYTSNHDSTEPPVAVRAMPQLRPEAQYERLPQTADPLSYQEESPISTDATLTPTSSEDCGERRAAEGSRFAFARLFRNFPFSRGDDNTPPEKIEYEKVRYDKLEDFEKGIPRFAALLESTDSFCIIPRMGGLTIRVILQRALELKLLDKELRELDKRDAAPGSVNRLRLFSAEYWEGEPKDKIELIDKIEIKLKNYYSLFLPYMEARALGQPPARDHASVINWMKRDPPLVKGEDDFLLYIEDLVSPRKKMESNSHLGNNIEDSLEWLGSQFPESFINRILKSSTNEMKTDNPAIFHHGARRQAILARIIIVVVSVCFLLIPVFLFLLLSMSPAAMALTIMSFVLTFAVVLAAVAKCKVHEIMLGTAAYAAFLVTILDPVSPGFALGSGSH